MSLFDRVIAEADKFRDQAGTDAYQHTDAWKEGRRNQMPAGGFFGKNKRYPKNANSWASTAGTMRQAYDRDPGLGKKIAQWARAKFGVCPTILKGCPPKRNHGEGGTSEHTTGCKGPHCKVTKKSRDHGGSTPWPFFHAGGAKYDKDWKALGGEKGSGGSAKQKAKAKASAAKKTKKGQGQKQEEIERRPLKTLAEAASQ